MNKKITFGIIAIAVLVVLFAVFYNKEEMYFLTSDDGELNLQIKISAIPNDVDTKDIYARKIDSKDFPLIFDNKTPVSAYSLEPSGLKLEEPANFILSAKLPKGAIPALYHISDNEFVRMNNINMSFNESDVVTMQGEINHFSSIFMMVDGFSVTVNAPSEAIVGIPFSVTATTTKIDRAYKMVLASEQDAQGDNPFMQAMLRQWKQAAGVVGRLTSDLEVGEINFLDPWELEGKLETSDRNIIVPAVINEAPAKTRVQNTDPLNLGPSQYVFNGTFTCKSPGKAHFIYTADIDFNTQVVWKVQPPFQITFQDADGPMNIVQNSNEIECKTQTEQTNDNNNINENSNGNGNNNGNNNENNNTNEEKDDCSECEEKEGELKEAEEEKIKIGEDISKLEKESNGLSDQIDALIRNAGCCPSQDHGGELKDGQSKGTVTSLKRSFFCPNEASAQKLTEMLEKFWETHKSPSDLEKEITDLKNELQDVENKINSLKEELKKCEECNK